MTEVRSIDGVSTAEQKKKVVTNPQEKAKAEKARTDAEIQRELLRNKEAQKQRRAELQTDYQKELELTEKEAKKAAKGQVKNEVQQEKFEKTRIFLDKDEYKKAVKQDKENKDLYKYVKDKKVRQMIEDNKDKFYDADGNFDEAKYKKEILGWAGDDVNLNLDERRAGAKEFGVKARHMKNAAKYANAGVERDNTGLYRTGYVLGTTVTGGAIGGLVGNAVGKNMTRDVEVAGKGGKNDFVTLPLENGGHVDVTVDTIVSAIGGGKVPVGQYNATAIGTASGAAAGLGIGLATMGLIKDNGGKDVFNGISAETIVKDGSKGVRGEANQKIVDGILGMENLTDEQKVQIIKEGYGENTGKKVNQRELLAAYSKAKELNGKIDSVPPKDDKPVDDKPVDDKPVDDKPVDDCPKTPGQEEVIKENEIKSYQYKPQKGEYWAGIVSAKYGINGKELKEAVHELKKLHGITDFNANIQPSVMNLPEELKGHKLNKDNKVTQKTDKFAPAKKYTGSYTNPKTQEKTTVFFYTDCNGNRSKAFGTAAERDAAMANDNVKKAA